MDWVQQIPLFLAGFGFIVIPGAGVAWVLGFRGLSFLAVSFAASLATIGCATVAAPILGMQFNIVTVILVAVTITVIVLGTRAIFGWKRISHFDAWAWQPFVFGAIPFVVIAVSLVISIGNPSAVSQTFDAGFHYNLALHIAETGNASPFTADLIWDTPPAFYPTLWQSFVSLLMPLSSSVIAPTNVTVILVAAIIWPVGLIVMVRTLLGATTKITLLASIFAAATPSFPLLLVDWGALYPNLLSFALIPIALTGLVIALNLSESAHLSTASRIVGWILIGGALLPIGLAQPNGVFAFILIAFVPAAATWVKTIGRDFRADKKIHGLLVLIAGLSLLIVLAVLWYVARNGSMWPVKVSLSQAAGDALLNAPPGRSPAVVFSAFVIAGIFVLFKTRKHLWLVGSYTAVVGVFIVSSALPVDFLRNILSGIWYADNLRIAALLPVVAVPIAVLGAGTALTALKKLSQQRGYSRFSSLLSNAPLAVIGLLLATQLLGMTHARVAVAKEYAFDEHSDLLTPDEFAVLQYIDQNLSLEAVVAGNPWTGTALAYAVTGRTVLFPHMSGRYAADLLIFAEQFKNGGEEICRIVDSYGATHVLDFGEVTIFDDPAAEGMYRGLNHLGSSSMVEHVFSKGDAKLYQVNGCS